MSTKERMGPSDPFRLVLCGNNGVNLHKWHKRAPACFSVEFLSSSTPITQMLTWLSDRSTPFALVGLGDGCLALPQLVAELVRDSCSPAHIVLIHPTSNLEFDSGFPLNIISNEILSGQSSSRVSLVPTGDMWSEIVLEQLCRIIATEHLLRCIHEPVLAQAIRTPNLTALVYEDTILSYADLCSRAWSLYCQLRPLVAPGAHIALMFPLGTELVVSYLAASMLQCPFTEVSITQPVEVTEFQLQEWQPELLLHVADQLPHSQFTVGISHVMPYQPFDSTEAVAELRHIWRTTQCPDIDSPAFIGWTSGSSGRSKGCCATHKNLANMAFWRWWEFAPTEQDRNVCAQNLFFVWYWFIPLFHGGTTVIIPSATLLDPPGLVELFEQHEVTRWDCASPTLLRTILQTAEPQVLQRLASQLTTMHSGGELLEVDTCRLFHQWLPGVRLINGFATTETVCDISYCDMTPQLTVELLAVNAFAAPVRQGHLNSADGLAWNSSFQLINLAPETAKNFPPASGQLVACGVQTAKAYYKSPEISECFGSEDGVGYVRLSDVAEELHLKSRSYLVVRGRMDSAVKVRGFRVELSVVEDACKKLSGVVDAAVVVNDDSLIAFVAGETLGSSSALLKELKQQGLPSGHVPSIVRKMAALPVTDNGKINRKKLLQSLTIPAAPAAPALRSSSLERAREQQVRQAWQQVLGHTNFSSQANFFEVGGHSLLVMRLARLLQLQTTQVLNNPTVEGLVKELASLDEPTTRGLYTGKTSSTGMASRGVAVVAMAVRVGNVQDLDTFWDALLQGREFGTEHTAAEIAASGAVGDDQWVPRSGALATEFVEGCDVELFGMSMIEARTTDPSQRLALECAYEVLETGGVLEPSKKPQRVGVFMSGGALPGYLTDVIDEPDTRVANPARYMQLEVGNDKDYIATRIAHKFNLTGPAKTIQTACSSSLVCIADAVESLRNGKCEMAIAGGAHVAMPAHAGYRYQPGMIWSPDGYCRPFDASASGTYECSAVGVVLLKREVDVLPTDQVFGIVRGIGVNNDGAQKAGYWAPSVSGQASVVTEAIHNAEIGSESIGYVECHGTGTVLGDPIEISALTKAHQATGAVPTSAACALGSVKSNMGHAGAAAGVMGFVKMVLSLHHKSIAPTLHFQNVNQEINLAKSRFYVAHSKSTPFPEPKQGHLRTAAVSAFGIGGTNVHLVAQEANSYTTDSEINHKATGDTSLLLLSAMTPAALTASEHVTAEWLASDASAQVDIKDVERTLTKCRWHLRHRAAVIGNSLAAAEDVLKASVGVLRGHVRNGNGAGQVVLLLAGADDNALARAVPLCQCWPAFDGAIKECQAESPLVVSAMLGSQGQLELGQFAVCYAMATAVVNEFGLSVASIVADGVGHLVAAVITGIMPLRVALKIVETQAASCNNWLQRLKPQSKAIKLPRSSSLDLIGKHSDDSDFNNTNSESSDESSESSAMLAKVKIIRDLRKAESSRFWQSPAVPIISCQSSEVISTDQLSSRDFWAQTVTHSAHHQVAMDKAKAIFPGAAVLQCCVGSDSAAAFDAELKLPAYGEWSAWSYVLHTAASLWCAGALVDWSKHLDRQASSHSPKAVVLPKYQFDRINCWPKAPLSKAAARGSVLELHESSTCKCKGVIYHTDWVAAPELPPRLHLNARTPIFGFDAESAAIVHREWPAEFCVCSGIEQAVQAGAFCGRLVLVASAAQSLEAVEFSSQSQLCWTLIELVQQLVRAHRRCKLWLASTDALQYSSLWGFAKAIALELPELEMSRVLWDGKHHNELFNELAQHNSGEQEVKLMPNGVRQVPRFVPLALKDPTARVQLNPDSTYIVTGGKRGLGLEVAKHMVCVMGARNLVLLGRSPSCAGAVELFMGWRENGCTVVERCVDVSDEESVGVILQYIHDKMPPLKGIVHCAGVVHDGVVLRADKPGTDAVLEPKLAAWTLHKMCAQYTSLDFMLLFSSTAAVWGTAGQGSYCAANAFLDQFAEWRSSEGHKTISVQWGGWDEVGMSADLGITSQNGEKYLTPQVGLAALHAILADSLASASSRAVVAAIDVQDKLKYRADRALFLNSHDPRVQVWDGPSVADGVQHPLLGVRLPSRCGMLHTWQVQFGRSVPGAEFLDDHTLDSTRIFPATGYIEMMLSACSTLPEFAERANTVLMSTLQFLHPLRVPAGEARAIQTMIQQKDVADSFSARISSCRVLPDGTAEENWVIHATCDLAAAHVNVDTTVPVDVVRECSAQSGFNAVQLYHEFGEAGFEYGPAFAAVRDVWQEGTKQAVGRVQACTHLTSDKASSQYLLHPALIDACAQLASLVHAASFGGVPASVAEIKISLQSQVQQLQLPEYWVQALPQDGAVDLSIWASDNAVRVPMVTMRGFELAALPGAAGPILYETTWHEINLSSTIAPTMPEGAVWIVWSTHDGSQSIADVMSEQLKQQAGQQCVCMQHNLQSGWAAAKGELGEHDKVAGVVVCDATPDTEVDDAMFEALWQLGRDHGMLEQFIPDARLWLVTTNGVSSAEADIRAATMQATARRLWADAPAVMCSVVELGAAMDKQSVEAICDLMHSGPECPSIVVLRDFKLLTPQLTRAADQVTEPVRTTSSELEPPAAGEAYQVRIEPSKGLAGVYTETLPLAPPASDEVQLDTSCWALNFRDVLVAIGAIPTLTSGRELGMGGECIGRVVAVGSAVEGFAVGDTVLGCPSDGFGSLANVPANFVFKLPECNAEAPHLLMVYATAWLALVKMGRIARGDTVLIHSAAGGVGLCAVHIAMQRGAVVYSTASTPEKRAYLEELGVSQTFSSRDLNFVDGIRAATNGKGVDLVLNSLSGSAMVASIDLLAPFGRFLEIGKRDQYEGTTVSLTPLLKGISICAAHLDVLMIEQPLVARAMMLEVWEQIITGQLPTLPTCTFPISQLPSALQYMSEGKHIGKIVVTMETGVTKAASKPRHVVCGPLNSASVWLAVQAAASGNKVSLLAPASAQDDTEKVASARKAAEAASVEITICQCADDISNKLDELQPIASMVHLALEQEQMAPVFARELHKMALHTRESLDSFVTLSPVTGSLLSESLVHCNEFDSRVPLHALLHALTSARQVAGAKPACCLCIDVLKLTEPNSGWVGSSCSEEHALRLSRVQRTPLDCLYQTICKLIDQPALQQCSFIAIPTAAHRLHHRGRSLHPIFTADVPISSDSLGKQVRKCVMRFVADLASISPEDVNSGKSLEEYGLDSLSALGLAAQLQAITPAASVLDVMDHSTVDELVQHLAACTTDGSQPTPAMQLLVLHGFRTNAEIAQVQLAPVLSFVGSQCVCEYVQAPHKATGPADPAIPAEFDLFEWWGEWEEKSDHGYLEAWRGPRYDGLQESLAWLTKYITEHGPFDGIVGFSQGAAMAALVLAQQQALGVNNFKFGIMFSGVAMPCIAGSIFKQIQIPTLHVYDQSEEFVSEMEGLHNACEVSSTQRIFHSEGHNIPKAADCCQQVVSFMKDQ